MKTLIIIIGLLFCLGCGTEKPITQINLGKCLEVRVIPTSFNEYPKTQIVTDKGFYILEGYLSFEKGADVIVNKNIIRR